MIFAVRVLIRFVNLANIGVDLREIGRAIDRFVDILRKGQSLTDNLLNALIPGIVPGQLSVREIRQVLVRARRMQVLPPSSRAPSPPPGTSCTIAGPEPVTEPSLEELAETLGLDWRADLSMPPDYVGHGDVCSENVLGRDRLLIFQEVTFEWDCHDDLAILFQNFG